MHYIYIYIQGVIQEIAVEALKHELGISNSIAEGFSGLFVSHILPYMASKCPKNVLKWTTKPTIQSGTKSMGTPTI